MTSKSGQRALRLFARARRLGYSADTVRRRTSARLFEGVLKRLYGPHLSYRALEDFAAEQAERGVRPRFSDLRLSIVVVTYRQPMALQCLLASLAIQVVQNFEVLVYHDGADPETRAVVDGFRSAFVRLAYHETPVRHNDWGHSLRELGLNEARGEYLLITNGDNYYVPRFTEFVFEAIETHRFDMVLWDLVHSYSSPGRRTLRCYTPFHVFPARYMIDIAAVLVRTALARKVGFPDKSHSADANYVEAILKIGDEPLAIGKVEKTLAVHN